MSPYELLWCSVTLGAFLGQEAIVRRLRPKGLGFGGCPVRLEEDVTFLLYTRWNPTAPQRLLLGDDASLQRSHIRGADPTVVYVHGFTEKGAGLSGSTIRDAYLRRGPYNVILVDWSELGALPFYLASVANCRVVGRLVALFIDFLDSRGVPLDNVHVVGFSLGAEIAGFTGQNLQAGRRPRLPRITGLDPAYPLFRLHNHKLRLSSDDAMFVDVIHTDGGILGIPSQIGHVDFFPNGGKPLQPGCDLHSIYLRHSLEDLVFCSHKRAWKYYAESLNNELGFPAYRCRYWMQFHFGHCSPSHGVAFMGILANMSAPGKYFLETNSNPPFATWSDPSAWWIQRPSNTVAMMT